MLTNVPCPFCGFTRSFGLITRGHWSSAIYNSPLSIALYLFVALIFLWSTAGLVLGVQIQIKSPLIERRIWMKALVGLTFLVVANWLYRLCIGLK